MRFAIIDTETNWNDEVMSIGTVIADRNSFESVSSNYYVIAPEYRVGGMFSGALFLSESELCSRGKALDKLMECFSDNQVTDIFAYNASFDRRHLPELSQFAWYDIMKLAAYRQHNPKIPHDSDCCGTGRLRRGFGVEPILRLLSDDVTYRERHNALTDALDELRIMRLLQHSPDSYIRIRK